MLYALQIAELRRSLIFALLIVCMAVTATVKAAGSADQEVREGDAVGSISGHVIDSHSQPLPCAQVRLHQSDNKMRDYGPAIAKTEADAQGRFQFPAVADGVYIVAADSRGLATSRFATILENKQHQKFEIALRQAVQPIIKFQTESGQPIAGVTLRELRCRDANGDFWLRTTSPQNWASLGMAVEASHADGLMRLPSLPDGTVITAATFDHADFAPVKIKDVPAASGVIATAAMHPGVQLKFHISPLADGKTVASVKLTVSHADRENPSYLFRQDLPVHDDGTATVTVEPGKYEMVQLEHDDYFVTPTYRQTDPFQSLEINSGQNNEFNFEVHRKISARGRVIDATTGQPIKEEYVAARIPNQTRSDWWHADGADTDAKGDYTLELPAGPVRLSIYCDDRTLGKAYLEVRIAEDGSTTLPDIKLRPNPKISGRVIDPDGKPVAGAIVRLQGIFKFLRQPPAATDNEGHFELQVRRVPEDFDSDSLELAWTHPLDVFHPTKPLSVRTEVHLDKPELFSNMTIQLQPEGYDEFLKRAEAPTTDWERKRLARVAEERNSQPSLIGQPAPELDGLLWANTEKPMRLADFRGKYVLLDFWTVWCGVCHAEFPEVKLLHETYKDQGLVVIGVHNNSVDADSVQEHIQQQGLKFPNVIDQRDGRILASYQKIGAVNGYPSYILIGPDGKIVQTDQLWNNKFEVVRKCLFGSGKSGGK